MKLSGVFTALVTPFRNGRVDLEAVAALAERQIEQGVHGLVACGCTGEAATMSPQEDRLVWKTVLKAARGRVPVIAGAGSNSTETTIEHAREAVEDGLDAVMLITPYYNKPTQEGLFRHYKAVAESVQSPIMLYNVPGRTACNLEPETVARLSKIPNIIAIKEASGTVGASSWCLKLCGPGFTVLSGDDPMFLPLATIGVKGVVSVASNVAPGLLARMWEKFQAGDLAGASEIHFQLLPLFQALFLETNPIPVKAALSMMGLIEEEYRLPLTSMTEGNKAKLRKTLADLGLVNHS
jgi:4-hydroxy-tetrahydrodipicolinate synthase